MKLTVTHICGPAEEVDCGKRIEWSRPRPCSECRLTVRKADADEWAQQDHDAKKGTLRCPEWEGPHHRKDDASLI